jgi:putative transposase
VNYARRRAFFEKRGVDLKATYKEYYEKYKTLIGSATAQQILNKNNEAWKSFFKMLKLKKESKLPPFITKISPPCVWAELVVIITNNSVAVVSEPLINI